MEFSSGFVSFFISEKYILFRILKRKHPAHYISTNFISTFIKFDRISPGFVHWPCVFTKKCGKAQNSLKGICFFQNSSHNQKRIKPIFKLAGKRFRDKINRKPTLPLPSVSCIKRFTLIVFA